VIELYMCKQVYETSQGMGASFMRVVLAACWPLSGKNCSYRFTTFQIYSHQLIWFI